MVFRYEGKDQERQASSICILVLVNSTAVAEGRGPDLKNVQGPEHDQYCARRHSYS